MTAPGDVLCRKYRIVRPLGAGGMGTVYEAENVQTGARLAVKLLHPDLLADRTARARFLREARTAARVGHRNIVEVYDLDMDDSGAVPFIVQELLVGRPLSAHLDSLPGCRMDARSAVATIVPVMGALVGAHRRGVVHRDLKPSNIFLCQGPGGAVTPKLIDFGIAKVREDGDLTALTAAGVVVGSPEYMSPEQVRGSAGVDAQTDVWSIGVVLYECVTGVVPFRGGSVAEVMAEVLHAPVPPVTSHGVDVPADLAAVIHRCVERDRSKRFPTIQRAVEALLETRAWSDGARAPVDFDTTERNLVSPLADAAVAADDAPTLLHEDTPTLGDPPSPADPPTLVRPPPTDPPTLVRRASAPARTPRKTREVPLWVLVVGAVVLVVVAALVGHAVGRAGRP
ncbi:MAG: serine/threonine-protein kinase [Polyangiales bacterium]